MLRITTKPADPIYSKNLHKEHSHQKNPEHHPQKEDQEEENTPEDLEKAVQSFCETDVNAKDSGLIAQVGQQGLTVVLKDVSGCVIRQVSQKEFLKLKKNHSSFLKVPGKILDQKF
jgi:uncharacterized FlaG/YvyC family protein